MPPIMSAKDAELPRAETDASLQAERRNTDQELARRVAAEELDADQVLRRARERADRLLNAARSAADARLPLSEQAKEAVALLLEERQEQDRAVAAERRQADELLDRERGERRDKLAALLMFERQTTDLHLALERDSADRAVASREEFLAQASHDLSGLLAAHKIYLALLLKEAGNGEQGRRLGAHLATLAKIDAQMERLISDLVDTVAIEAGKLAVTPRACSAAELLSTAVAVFEPTARERGQSLSVPAMPADVKVMADPVRVVQILSNLLSNAIKFTPPHGKIRAGFQATPDEIVAFVADTGPGIPAEQAERIFERFVGSGTAPGGLGLGLFIAQQLVDAHGGRLWLESDPSQGTVFRFTLQRAPAETLSV